MRGNVSGGRREDALDWFDGCGRSKGYCCFLVGVRAGGDVFWSITRKHPNRKDVALPASYVSWTKMYGGIDKINCGGIRRSKAKLYVYKENINIYSLDFPRGHFLRGTMFLF